MDYDVTPLGRARHDYERAARRALGLRLRCWRLAAGMTQGEMAEATGLRRDRVSMVEGGRVAVEAPMIAKIADVVGAGRAPDIEVREALALVGGAL